MFRHTALFLALAHFFHIALAVPNPAVGVSARDPTAATVDLYSKVNGIASSPEPTNRPSTEILSLLENITNNTIVPRVSNFSPHNNCNKPAVTKDSPTVDEILGAVGEVIKRGNDLCIPTITKPLRDPPDVPIVIGKIGERGRVAIYFAAPPDALNTTTCFVLGMQANTLVRECTKVFGKTSRSGGIRFIGEDSSVSIGPI